MRFINYDKLHCAIHNKLIEYIPPALRNDYMRGYADGLHWALNVIECQETFTDWNDRQKLLQPEHIEFTKRSGRKEMINFDDKAMEIVKDYITEHLDKSDPVPNFTVFTVWKCKILQNWKYLISSTLPDGMYYELTYNGDKNEWYLDAYKKFQNMVVK